MPARKTKAAPAIDPRDNPATRFRAPATEAPFENPFMTSTEARELTSALRGLTKAIRDEQAERAEEARTGGQKERDRRALVAIESIAENMVGMRRELNQLLDVLVVKKTNGLADVVREDG